MVIPYCLIQEEEIPVTHHKSYTRHFVEEAQHDTDSCQEEDQIHHVKVFNGEPRQIVEQREEAGVGIAMSDR